MGDFLIFLFETIVLYPRWLYRGVTKRYDASTTSARYKWTHYWFGVVFAFVFAGYILLRLASLLGIGLPAEPFGWQVLLRELETYLLFGVAFMIASFMTALLRFFFAALSGFESFASKD